MQTANARWREGSSIHEVNKTDVELSRIRWVNGKIGVLNG